MNPSLSLSLAGRKDSKMVLGTRNRIILCSALDKGYGCGMTWTQHKGSKLFISQAQYSGGGYFVLEYGV